MEAYGTYSYYSNLRIIHKDNVDFHTGVLERGLPTGGAQFPDVGLGNAIKFGNI